QTELETYFTVHEVARKLRKSEISVSRWLREGKLPFTQVSERRRLISEADLQNFLDSRRITKPKKRVDVLDRRGASSMTSSLKKENYEGDIREMDVKSLRKEISLICRSS
ncbi:MAG: helix-turn-helix domain-containing protein, partial [Pseudomonadota bacterium]